VLKGRPFHPIAGGYRLAGAKIRELAFYLSYLVAPDRILPRALPRGVSLSPRELFLLGRDLWYHDFTVIGFPTPQEPGMFGPNQQAKQAPLFELIGMAIDLATQNRARVSGVDLFCGDGFYTNYAVTRGAASMLGVDTDEKSLAKARVITRVLGHQTTVAFQQCDVRDVNGQYDFGICAGGLYHISDPEALLARLRRNVRVALVIQTVYSLAVTSALYFESPAPGWTWGCRFSYPYLMAMVDRAGWSIQRALVNELPGNDRPEDRGSAYLLCLPRTASQPSGGEDPVNSLAVRA
jgi:predicted RNA methylase